MSKRWPPADKKLMLVPSGSCFIVKRYGSHVRGGPGMGRICQKADGWYYGYERAGAKRATHGPKRTKAAAIKAVVKSYRASIGL